MIQEVWKIHVSVRLYYYQYDHHYWVGNVMWPLDIPGWWKHCPHSKRSWTRPRIGSTWTVWGHPRKNAKLNWEFLLVELIFRLSICSWRERILYTKLFKRSFLLENYLFIILSVYCSFYEFQFPRILVVSMKSFIEQKNAFAQRWCTNKWPNNFVLITVTQF